MGNDNVPVIGVVLGGGGKGNSCPGGTALFRLGIKIVGVDVNFQVVNKGAGTEAVSREELEGGTVHLLDTRNHCK